MANPTVNEKFINWITGLPISLFDAASSIFTAAGANATIGLVPKPGASANTPPFYLGDDGVWHSVQGAITTIPYWTQCRLTLSGSNLLLSPYGGNQLTINSINNAIPDAGVTLAPTALIAATFYYIYAFMNGSTMTLEASTTAPAAQAGTGIQIKTGDATRSLVGAAYTDTGPAWADADGKLWVLSYYNRRRKSGKTQFTTNRSTTSTTLVEINTEIRNQFISWADETVIYNVIANISTANNTVNVYSGVGIDGITRENEGGSGTSVANNNLTWSFAMPGFKNGLTEAAVHYATLLGAIGGGITATYAGGAASPNPNCTISVSISG